MIFCVGLTGNIASGKTTVSQIFAKLGVNIINADTIAKDLTVINQPAYKEIITHFGSELMLENGQLNRRRLREIIFSNAEERKWLENLLHPLIRHKIKEQIDLCTQSYCIIEIPLLTDKKLYPYLNKILVVHASEEVQISRVMNRDHCSKEQAKAILSTQPDMRVRLNNADDVLLNDFGLNELNNAVTQLHNKYLKET